MRDRGNRAFVLQFATGLLVLGLAGCTGQAKINRHLRRGEEFFSQRKHREATIEYLNVLRIAPSNSLAIERIGLSQYALRDFRRAFFFLKQAVDLNPGNLDTRLKLGTIYLIGGEAAEAQEEADLILAQQPQNIEARVLSTLATASLTNGASHLEEAFEKLQSLEADFADPVRFRLTLGTLYLKQRDMAKAEQAFRAAVTADPQRVQSRLALGDFYLLRGAPDQAEVEYRAAVGLAPTSAVARAKLAEWMLMTGRKDEGWQMLKEITAQESRYAHAPYRCGELAFADGDYETALTYLEKALAADPYHVPAFVLRGRAKLAMGRKDEVIQSYAKAIAAYPRAHPLRYELALIHLRNGDPISAITELREVVAAKPDDAEALWLLADLNIRTGTPDAAIAMLEDFLKRYPDRSQSYVLLGRAYRAKKDLTQAAAAYRKLIEAVPDQPQGYYLLGLTLREQGETVAAAANFEKALEVQPAFLDPLGQLILMDVGDKKDYASALRRVDRQIGLYPTNGILFYLRGRVHAAKGDWNQAEADIKKTIELSPSWSGAFLALGQLYAAAGKDEEALVRLDEALNVNSNHIPSLMMKGIILQRRGEQKQAAAQYERILSFAPNFVAALNNLAYLHGQDPATAEQAFELAKKARDLAPQDPYIADTLGWLACGRGEHKWALSLLQESADKLPSEPEVLYHLGACQYAQGQEEAARSTLDRALAAGRGFAGAERAERLLRILRIDLQNVAPAQLPELEACLAEDPRNASALVRIGALHERQGHPEKARETYEATLADHPQFVPAMLGLAALYAAQPELRDKGFELAKAARDIAPRDPRAADTLGWIAFQRNDFTWGRSLLDEAARALPEDVQIRYHLGRVSYMFGDVGRARELVSGAVRSGAAFAGVEDAQRFLDLVALAADPAAADALPRAEAALAAAPDDLPALVAAAAVRAHRGETAREFEIYERIVNRYPTFAPGVKRLATLYWTVKQDKQRAYTVAMQARDLLPADPAVASLLGQVAYAQGKYDWAERLLQESIAKVPGDARALYYLGMCRYQAGDTAAARERLQAALSQASPFPEAEEAKRLLAEIP